MTPAVLASLIKCDISVLIRNHVEVIYQNIQGMTLDELNAANKTAQRYIDLAAEIYSIFEKDVFDNADK